MKLKWAKFANYFIFFLLQEDEFEEEIASNKNKTRKSRKNSKKEEEEDETTDNLVGIVNDKLQKKRDILLNTHPMTLSIIIPLTVLCKKNFIFIFN